jgi:hypothetical protein
MPVDWDPTWGFYLFFTDYTEAVKEKLPGAIEMLISVQQRKLRADSVIVDPYVEELCRRLRFDVVEDQEALEGASIDRVRECFRVLVRSFELSDDENIYPPPARNMVCLMLDGGQVEMLANLEFFDNHIDELIAHQQCKLQAVDVHWKRPEMIRDNYRGARYLEISSLAQTYDLLDSDSLDEVEQ